MSSNKGIRQQMEEAGPQEDDETPKGLRETFESLANDLGKKQGPTYVITSLIDPENGRPYFVQMRGDTYIRYAEEEGDPIRGVNYLLTWYKSDDIFWFRLFGVIGLSFKHKSAGKPYSFKHGYVKSMSIGNWRVRPIF